MIEYITLTNICQHRSTTINFEPGLFTLLGLNGTGKSNLVAALYFGLTGDAPSGKQPADLLAWNRSSGSVELRVVLPAGVAVISRTFRRSGSGVTVRHRLTTDVLDEPLSKKTEIAAYLEAELGASMKALEQISFARQGEFDSLLTDIHTSRVQLLYRLFECDKADEMRKLLHKYQGMLPVPADRSTDLKELQQQYETLVGQKQQADAKVVELKGSLTGLEPTYQQTVKLLELPLTADVQQQLDQKASLLAQAEAEKADLEKARGSIHLPDPPDEHAAAAYRRLQQVLSQLQETEAQLNGLAEPPAPSVDPLSLIQKLQEADSRLRDLQQRLEVSAAGRCPTCGTAFPTSPEDLDRLRLNVTGAEQDKQSAAEDYQQAVAAKKKYETLTTQYQRVTATLQDRRESLEKERLDLQPQASGHNPEEYERRTKAYQESVRKLQQTEQAEKDYQQALQRVATLTAEIEQIKRQPTIEEGARQSGLDFCRTYREVQERQRTMEASAATLSGQINALMGQLQRFEKEQQRARSTVDTVEILDQGKQVLHPDCLPKLAVQQSVQELNAAFAEYLQLFGFPYHLYLSPDLDFCFDHPDQQGAPASALSGGQLIIASIALRFAFFDMCSEGYRLLVLDEPTAYLDQDNIPVLLRVLEKAATHLQRRSITLLVPTHERSLTAIATQTHNLGG